jgi:hypothetical protein
MKLSLVYSLLIVRDKLMMVHLYITWVSFKMIPIINIDIASALITCIILMSMLVGLFGSFFLKKYMTQMYKIKRHFGFNSTSNSIKNRHKKKGSDKSEPFHMLFKKY